MQIIIPMSGFGERFRRAGYSAPKPLIEIEGKPIVAHVIDMFPGETDFIFICNQDHLDDAGYQMESTIRRYCPSGKIIGIPPHKFGPIHAVRQVERYIDPNRQVVVNYCDFTCYWDWSHFKKFVTRTACQGAIPAYKGFHPHTLGSTNYAYMRELNGWVQDIQEKQPYTDDRMTEYASSGTYYFATAKVMFEAFRLVVYQGMSVNGEYYVSLAYKPIISSGHRVAAYPIQHFMQWGTPEDVAEYRMWSKAFCRLVNPFPRASHINGSVIVPMAGLGQRFANEGYALTKPFIPVSGMPMVVQATHDLPAANQYVFVVRSEGLSHEDVSLDLQKLYPSSIIKKIDFVTEGQACTALIGLNALEDEFPNVTGPLTIGACDNGALYDAEAFQDLLDNPDVDVIVWGVRGFPNAIRYPRMFGWINANDKLISSISVKEQLDNPRNDPIVLGTFTFRRAEDFRSAVERLIARDGRINGEFYIDSCINDAVELGLRCHLFEVDSYLCWGTPNDLRTFEYWQSCFHKWPGHPYRLELDRRIPADQLREIEARYRAILPQPPSSPHD